MKLFTVEWGVHQWDHFPKQQKLGSFEHISLGRGGGQVVSVLAFYSNDPSSNPAEAYSFSCKMCVWEERK